LSKWPSKIEEEKLILIRIFFIDELIKNKVKWFPGSCTILCAVALQEIVAQRSSSAPLTGSSQPRSGAQSDARPVSGSN